jgi:ABC-type proline/glycine betaine transport system ATPase subunit
MTQPFPPDLLHQPPADRLAWFRQKVIRHPHLDTAFQSVQDAIRAPAGATLILVIGATGIGKTTLRLRLERQLITEAQGRMSSDPGAVPDERL